MTEWQDKVREYRAAGFSYDQISAEAERRQEQYRAAGFSQQQIDDYFGGIASPSKYAEVDIAARAMMAPPDPEQPQAAPAKTLLQSFEAGFDMSALGLAGGRPDRALPENPQLVDRLAYGLGVTAGDFLPAVAGGAVAGAAAVETGPLGMATAGGAGALALPEAIRSTYVQYYEKGGISSPRDFLDRVVTTFVDTSKAAVIGAVTGGSGGLARGGAAAAGAGKAMQNTAQLTAEAAGLVTASSALEGQLPTPESLIDAGAQLVLAKAGMKAGAGAVKLQKIAERNLLRHWRDTGEMPAKAAERAMRDAAFRERMLVNDPTLDTETVTLRDADGVEMTVTRRVPKEEGPEGKVTAEDPTGETSPVDQVLSVFERRSNQKTFTDFMHDLYKEHFDEAHPFNRMVDALAKGGEAADGEQVKMLMEDTYYSAPRAEYAMKNGFGKDAPGLDAIVPADAVGLKNFRALVGALHAAELHQKGVENPVPPDAAIEVIKTLGSDKDLLKRARQFTQFNNHLLTELVDSGVISSSVAEGWKKEFTFYAPFNRVLEEAPASGIGAGNKRVFQPKKAQKGSEKNIYDPLESTIRNAYAIYQVADRNRAFNALYDLAKANPELAAGWIKEKPLRKIKVDLTEKELGKLGLATEETITLWRTARQQAGKNDVVLYRDGEVKLLEVDPEVARFIGGLDKTDLGLVGKLLEVPNRMLKGGITLSPEFPIVQVLRDNPWQYIFNKDTPAPFADLVAGATHILSNSPEFQQWQRDGGALSTIRNLGDTYKYGDFGKRYDMRAGRWQTTRNVITSPLQLAKAWADFWANAPRVGVFARQVGKGASKQEALRASRESQLNFMRQGTVARQLNRIMPFYSPALNALERMITATKENPATVTARGAMLVTLPVMAAWALYRNEEWYKEMPQWQKDQSVPIRIGNTTYLLPLPPGASVLFGGIPRRMAEAFQDHNPRAADGIAESFLVSFTPAISISAFTPIIEHVANYSFFRKRPLVSDRLKGALPEDQYTPYTSEAAIQISHALTSLPGLGEANLNPIVVENYVKQWLGTTGRHALEAADAALRAAGIQRTLGERPSPTAGDIPFFSRFVADFPSNNAASLTAYYDNLRKYDAVMKSLQLTKDRLPTEPGAAKRLENLYLEHQRELLFLDDTREVLSQQRDLIELVEANPDMPGEDKRRIIDETQMTMIMVAREANAVFEEIKAGLNTAEKELER